MPSCFGQNISIGMAVRERIGDRVAEAALKYLRDGFSGIPQSAEMGFGFRPECVFTWTPERCSRPKARPLPMSAGNRIKKGCATKSGGEKVTQAQRGR
jgi:hypothetical protein